MLISFKKKSQLFFIYSPAKFEIEAETKQKLEQKEVKEAIQEGIQSATEAPTVNTTADKVFAGSGFILRATNDTALNSTKKVDQVYQMRMKWWFNKVVKSKILLFFYYFLIMKVAQKIFIHNHL